MFLYNLRIALKSLRRNPYLTAVIVSAIALGICVATTFTALRHIMVSNPVSHKEQQLYYIRMDNWDPARPYDGTDPRSLPSQITYRDMRELMKSNIPVRQTGSFKTRMFVFPDPKVGRPYNETVRVVFSDFFPMFEVPFQWGGPWDKRAESVPEPVVVIDQKTNDRLFGGGNSVGKTVRLEDRNYKVIGVMAKWRPPMKFYDPTQGGGDPPEGIFMPFNFTPLLQLNTAGNSDGWKSAGNTYEEFLQSDTDWIQFWVELPNPQSVQAYRDFVNAYVMTQKKVGRFPRPLHTEVTSLKDAFKEFQLVPPQVHAMAVVSLLFLAVCSLNLVGLYLGKFLARVPEVSVRRALGASRSQVFMQHIVECEVAGVIGGAIGLLLSAGVLSLLAKLLPMGDVIRVDTEIVLIAIFLSLGAGLLAGIYPSWRICTIPPAMQLKVQ